MSGPEHYKASEQWLFKAEHAGARRPEEAAESCAAIAQVHATLALVTAMADVHPTTEWHKVAAPEVTP